MKVNSATFYQAVRLGDGNQHNTIYPVSEGSMDNKYEGVEMYFKNGMMVITGKDARNWLPQNKELVYFVGITNIRNFCVEPKEVKGTPFDGCVAKKDYPTRKDMMDFLREKNVKFAGNITTDNLKKIYDTNCEVKNGQEKNK